MVCTWVSSRPDIVGGLTSNIEKLRTQVRKLWDRLNGGMW